MLRLSFSIALCLFCSIAAKTQSTVSFNRYAQQQDSIFVTLYKKRDAAAYNRLLQQWLTNYRQLDSADKKTYRHFLINAYYNLSCTYALNGNTGKALDELENAVNAGYANYAHMQQDSDLATIRSLPRYHSLAEQVRAVGDYRYILQKGQQYNEKDNRPLPAFTYQPASDPHLAELRKTFNLDSVAGAGNDISKVLNLLHWVHEGIPHDGNRGNPVIKNAQQLINTCRKEKRGLNCRGLATVLNECYLSMGFASRMVTCLPKDSLGIDPDCHVINMVFIPSLKKWIWADPTQDAYIMNEKGELLGIEEVRERIIDNRPLILNPTANWNHRSSTTKEYYLYRYMAKNLYILQCSVNSAYDLETPAAGKTIEYVQLLPLDYFRQEPAVKTYTSKSKTTYVYYTTNNPAAFWKNP